MRTPVHQSPGDRGCGLLRRGGILTAGSLATFWPAVLQAQEEAGGGGSVTTAGRSWMVDAVIVGVMFGLALFVVCRSSRRN